MEGREDSAPPMSPSLGTSAVGTSSRWWGSLRTFKSQIANSIAAYSAASCDPDAAALADLAVHQKRFLRRHRASADGSRPPPPDDDGTGPAPVSAESVLYGGVARSGWLLKQTVLRCGVVNKTRWKMRFCVAHRGMLSYFVVRAEDCVDLRAHAAASVVHVGDVPERLGDLGRCGYRFVLRLPLAALTRASDPAAQHSAIASAAPQPEAGAIAEAEDALPAQLGGLVELLPVDGEFALLRLSSNSAGEQRRWAALLGGGDGMAAGLLLMETRSGAWLTVYLHVDNGSLYVQVRERAGVFPLAHSVVEDLGSGGLIFSIKNAATDKALNMCAATAAECDLWCALLGATCDVLQSNRLLEQSRLLLTLSPEALDFVSFLRGVASEHHLALLREVAARRASGSATSAAPHLRNGRLLVLSMDGGGVRGLLNCIILQRLCERVPDLLSRVGFFCGTSNGGMLAAGLAFGYTPDVLRMLMEAGTADLMRKRSGPTAGATRSKFSSEPMMLLCQETLGGLRLCDCDRLLLLPSYLLDNCSENARDRRGECRYYHNVARADGEHSPTVFEDVGDLIMRTAAAPTYFSSHQRHVDGGFFAQNPASAAMALVLDRQLLGLTPDRLRILSLGTGRVNHHWPDETHDWGMIGWLPHLATVLWDGMEDHTNFICRSVLGDAYLRFQPYLSEEIALDDPLALTALVRLSQQVDIEPLVAWINSNYC